MKSMTGFGRSAATLPDATEVSVLVRGVNHRFLDVGAKIRDEFASEEAEIRRLVARVTSRGHVDVVVRILRPAGRAASFDDETAARYASLWRDAASRRGLPGELSARDLLALPGVVRTEEAPAPDDMTSRALLKSVEEALGQFDAARSREGEALAAALSAILGRLEEGLTRLQGEQTGLTGRLSAALADRVAKLAAGLPLDEARLAQEVALLADRADVSEEIERFRAHLLEARRLCTAAGPVGKRLDHLAQEMHREMNTAGQKVREIGATRAVLDLKADVEAFKEQAQNVE